MDKVDYTKLFQLLEKRHISIMHLQLITGLSTSTIAKMRRNEYVSLEVLVRLCRALHCQINAIVEVDLT